MTNRHPRAHESAARRAQLERIKEQRRARREARPARIPRTVGSFTAIGPDVPAPPTYPQFVAAIQRLAMGGVMPDAERFDYAKPSHWPTADALCAQFGTSWNVLADDLGLRLREVCR